MGVTSWVGGPTTSGGTIGWIAVGLCSVAMVPAAIRWLRVAQREHYLPGSVSRFAVALVDLESDEYRARSLRDRMRGCLAAMAGRGLRHGGRRGDRTVRIAVAGSDRPSRVDAAPRPVDGRLRLMQSAIVGVLGVVLRAPVVAAFALLASPRVIDAACLVNLPLEHAVAATVPGTGQEASGEDRAQGRRGYGVVWQDEHQAGDRGTSFRAR